MSNTSVFSITFEISEKMRDHIRFVGVCLSIYSFNCITFRGSSTFNQEVIGMAIKILIN